MQIKDWSYYLGRAMTKIRRAVRGERVDRGEAVENESESGWGKFVLIAVLTVVVFVGLYYSQVR